MDGYKIIDFKNIPIDANDPPVIPGIYDSIDSSNKPLVISNITLTDGTNNVNIKPFFSGVVVKDTDDIITLTLGDLGSGDINKLLIADNDSVLLV